MKKPSFDRLFQGFISQKNQSGELPTGAGISVAVVQDGQPIFFGASGLRERDRNLPVTPDTIFETGSSTKALTAAALLLANDEGKFGIDAPINGKNALLNLKDPVAARDVTFVDILSHRTGMPSYDMLWYFGPKTPEKMREGARHLEPFPNAFRKGFNYNNLMYGIAGSLFDSVVGESWDSYVTQKFLKPLKMTSTSFSPEAGEGDVALPYSGTQCVKRVDMSAVAAAGAMKSSARDMAKWMAFHLGGGKNSDGKQVLSETSIRRMQEVQIEIQDKALPFLHGQDWLVSELGYGLGWFIGTFGGKKAVFHPGFIDGFSSLVVMIPEAKIGVTVLSNLNVTDAPGRLSHLFLSEMLGMSQTTPEAAKTASAKDAAAAGVYENPAFGPLTLALHDQRLVLEYNGNAWPVNWQDENTAQIDLKVFGMPIPLPIRFEPGSGQRRELHVPFGLDPRLPFLVFKSRS